MIIEITIAVLMWLAVTALTPSRVRPFISIITALTAVILLYFFSLHLAGEPKVHIPAQGKELAYELTLSQFNNLSEKDAYSETLLPLGEAEDLRQLGKEIITHDDLSPEQMKYLSSHPDFIDFVGGKKGMIIRYIPPHVEKGVLSPGSYGAELTELPYIDVNSKLKRKQAILDSIRAVVNDGDEAGNM